MEFDFSQQELQAREHARSFIREHIDPLWADPGPDRAPADELFHHLGQAGLLAALISKEEGGSDLGWMGYVLCLMEIARVWGSLASVLLVHNSFYCIPLQMWADAEQKDRYLQPCLKEFKTGCLAFAEAESGLDFESMQTGAARHEKGWLIQGKKEPVANGRYASYVLLAAKAPGREGREGLSLFMAQREKLAGFRIGAPHILLGLREAGWTAMDFEQVLLPPHALLGESGQGRRYWEAIEQKAWTAVAAVAVGISRAILDEIIRFSDRRVFAGKPLSASQSIQWPMADLATEVEIAELLTLRAAWLMDQNKFFEKEGAMARKQSLQVVSKAGRAGMQILAGHGPDARGALARYVEDAQGCLLFANRDEVLAGLITKSLCEGR